MLYNPAWLNCKCPRIEICIICTRSKHREKKWCQKCESATASIILMNSLQKFTYYTLLNELSYFQKRRQKSIQQVIIFRPQREWFLTMHQIMIILNSLLHAWRLKGNKICLLGISSHKFNHTITIRHGKSFNQRRHKNWNIVVSREQEQNKRKNISTSKVMKRRDLNTSITWNKSHRLSMLNESSP